MSEYSPNLSLVFHFNKSYSHWLQVKLGKMLETQIRVSVTKTRATSGFGMSEGISIISVSKIARKIKGMKIQRRLKAGTSMKPMNVKKERNGFHDDQRRPSLGSGAQLQLGQVGGV